MTKLDTADQTLLEQLQSGFPLTPRPFAVLGRPLDMDEHQVLERVKRLKKENVIRQIGAIFDTRRLGYQSTLVAFHVADKALQAAAERISAHPGVSHNYARPHYYNLWFTLALPPDKELRAEIDRLARRVGVDDWLNLPSIHVFKIRTHFKIGNVSAPRDVGRAEQTPSPRRAFTQADIPLVRALQVDLPLVSRPFARAAEQLGLDEETLLDKARELQEAGIMRRFSAVLRHRRVGYRANGMACWVVPEEKVQAVGRCAATFSQVSHCYQRPVYPRWPYSLFTMIHGQTRDEVEAVVDDISRETGIEEYQVLYSTREFKKERVRYFEEAI